jgi:hypothetical protein
MSRARSHAADAMIGASSLCTLIAGAAIISPEVRAGISNAFAGDPAGQLSAVASRGLDFVHVLSRVAADYRPENGPLVGFGIVALFLTIMMSRA